VNIISGLAAAVDSLKQEESGLDSQEVTICIKGAGEMASGIAVRLHRSGFTRLLMLEVAKPLAVRRLVCFSEAVHDTVAKVEDVTGRHLTSICQLKETWKRGEIAVLIDPAWKSIVRLHPEIVIDATIAKKNLGTTICEAPLVIGIGPGFSAGRDVHKVIETMRGHHLGRVIDNGPALPNTGIPGNIGGYTLERILRSPASGCFYTNHKIGDHVRKGETVGWVDSEQVVAGIDGMLRGLIRQNTPIKQGVKIGDIDPRGEISYKDLVSDKARSIGGGVLEAILGAPHLKELRQAQMLTTTQG